MTPASRRILAYWLLLLVPTLAAGVGAYVLLRREETRLATRAAYAAEARRAAVAARAGLIVENLELIAGDVQAALLDALAGLPSADLPGAVEAWQRDQPLARAAFVCAADGRVVFPAAGSAGETARGFLRRIGPWLQATPPWRGPEKKVDSEAEVALPAAASKDEKAARLQALSNIASYQSARRDAKMAAAPRNQAVRSVSAESSLSDAAPAAKTESGATARRGWSSPVLEGRRHLLGWLQEIPAGEVRGVEVEMAALVARLGGALPAESGSDEGYALRDERGRIMHQSGRIPSAGAAPAVRLPLAGALAGWEVVGFLADAEASSSGGGFFFLGSLLAAILGVAILAGGSLLLWQARASEAEAARKTSFVANVSHEFKTPLTTIRLYSELLEQGRVAGEERQRDYLRTIGRETERLARLVGNALDFSRLEQGRKKFTREPLDLRAELDTWLSVHEPRLAESGLRLVRALPAGPLECTTDRDALQQVLLNLLDNAAKYAAAGGEVTVELARSGAKGARLAVLDRGPGVPVAHRQRIFEKFHRVDDTLTTEKGGTGLGLSIARQLARGLGGDLRFAPREGGGSAFLLELP